MTQLPLDQNDHPIPALRLKSDGAHMISTSITSARNTTAFDENTRVVSVYASEDTYIRFGDGSVSASGNDHFIPAGLYYDFAIGGDVTGQHTHLAVLRVTTDGTLYISEKE